MGLLRSAKKFGRSTDDCARALKTGADQKWTLLDFHWLGLLWAGQEDRFRGERGKRHS